MKILVQSLPGRIALVMLAAWVTAAITPLIFLVNLTILPVALKWASVAGISLVAGLASRRLLSQHTQMLRLVTTFLALSSSLWLAGWLSQGYVGFNLFLRSTIEVDWVGLGQLAFGCLSAWLALYAWRISPTTKKAARKPSTKQSRSPAPSAPKRAPRKTIKAGKPVKPQRIGKPDRRLPATRKRVPIATRSQPLTAIQHSFRAAGRSLQTAQRSLWATQRNYWATRRRSWANTMAGLNLRLQTLRTTGRALRTRLHVGGQNAQARLRQRLKSRPARPVVQLQSYRRRIPSTRPENSPVHLVGEMEHRCPYCLELVERNDPRGVRVCPVCHTRHHADCWAVTGVCQVPHQYE